MTDGFVFLSALTGFALLLLSMRRHQHDWLRRRLSHRTGFSLRLAGFLLLILAFVIAGTGLGWAYGVVCWFGWLTIAATMVTLIETNRHRFIRILAHGRRRP